MRVASTQNNQPNFKSVCLIQIEKSAFKHSKGKVFDEFNKALGKAVHQPTGFSELMQYIGGGKNKVEFIFEQPLFREIQVFLRNGVTLSQAMGTEIKGPLNDTHYSFFVYTKEHADKFRNVYDHKRPTPGIPAFPPIKKYSLFQALLLNVVKFNNFLNDALQKEMQGEPIQFFKLKSLSELPAAMQELGY